LSSTSTVGSRSSTESNGNDDDSGDNDAQKKNKKMKKPTVVVLAYPHVAITSDLTPLESDPSFNVEWRRNILPDAPYPHVDAVILPGSRLTRSDLDWLNNSETGWGAFLREHAANGGAILGLCGGYQMLGMTVSDPDGVEGEPGTSEGLGLLPVETTIAKASCKIVTPRSGVLYQSQSSAVGEQEQAQALSVEGFELHCGRTAKIMDSDTNHTSTSDEDEGTSTTDDGAPPTATASTLGAAPAQAPAQPLVIFTDDISKDKDNKQQQNKDGDPDGTDEEGMRVGRVCGTYLHGILAKRNVRRALLLDEDVRDDNEDPVEEVDALDLLAKHLEDCGLDFETVSKMINW
jgi:cobyric acid synthase